MKNLNTVSDHLYQYYGDSSNFAPEGYGIFEALQFMRKSPAERESERKRLAGSTTEAPENVNEQIS